MSEESFIGKLKNQIIAGVGVALTTAGTVFLDEIKVQLGLAEPVEEVATEPAAQQQPEIIINIPEQKKDTVVKYVAPKKEKTATEKRKDEFDW